MYLVYFLSHFLIPGHSNNHKAKLLHTSTVGFMIMTLILYQVFIQFIPSTGVRVLGFAANISPQEVISLTNQKRAEVGASPLTYNDSLARAAKAKGEHMLANDYWAHVAPDGTEPWFFFQQVGYKYRYAGENLARDFSNPQSAVDAWMASPTHKDNMLSTKYDEIGIAVVEGDLNGVDTTVIVQLFGKGLTTVVSVPEADASNSQSTKDVDSIVDQDLPAVSNESVDSEEVELSGDSSDNETFEIPTNTVASAFEMSDANFTQFQISPFSLTRNISLSLIVTLLIVLVFDSIIISRNKVPRVGGRTFAHVVFLGVILAIIIVAKAGKII